MSSFESLLEKLNEVSSNTDVEITDAQQLQSLSDSANEICEDLGDVIMKNNAKLTLYDMYDELADSIKNDIEDDFGEMGDEIQDKHDVEEAFDTLFDEEFNAEIEDDFGEDFDVSKLDPDMFKTLKSRIYDETRREILTEEDLKEIFGE